MAAFEVVQEFLRERAPVASAKARLAAVSAERLAADASLDGATLALDLGYADQAHFIRDFRRLVGKTPAEYSRTFRRSFPHA